VTYGKGVKVGTRKSSLPGPEPEGEGKRIGESRGCHEGVMSKSNL